MKKLITSLMLGVILMVAPSAQESNASTDTITWVNDEGLDAYVGTVDVPAGTVWLEISMINGDDMRIGTQAVNDYTNFSVDFCTNTCITPDISLFDSINENTNIFYDTSSASEFEYTNILIDLESYGIPGSSNIMEITIPYEFYASQVFTKLQNDTIYTAYSTPIPIGKFVWALELDQPIEGQTARYHDATTQFIEVPLGTDIIEFSMDINARYSTALGEPLTELEYYNSDKELINTTRDMAESTSDWYTSLDADIRVWNVPWRALNYDVNNEARYIKLHLYNVLNGYPFLSFGGVNTETYAYYFDGESITVNFIVDGEIDETSFTTIGNSVRRIGIKPDIEGYEFSKWVDVNGEYWDGDAITAEMVNNGIVNLYAIYIETPDIIDTSIDESTGDPEQFDILLDDLGFNDGVERIVVFAMVLLVVTILLFAKGVQLFSVLVVDAIILAFFMTLGLIPTFASITITLVLIAMGVLFLKTGGSSNET